MTEEERLAMVIYDILCEGMKNRSQDQLVVYEPTDCCIQIEWKLNNLWLQSRITIEVDKERG